MEEAAILAFVVIACVIVFATLGIFSRNSSVSRDGHLSGEDTSHRETYKKTDADDRHDHFPISNYLHLPVRIKVERSGKAITLVDKILPRKLHLLHPEKVAEHLNSGAVFKVYTYNPEKPHNHPELFASYKLDTPKDTTVKSLHIGMITSRWIGGNSDYNIGKPGLNAVQGLPWVRIHNLTDRPLALNENINISPGGMLRYTGRDHFGVRLGTVFKDQDDIFSDFIFTIPATDVYYGVTSDVPQSLFGGFQLEHKLNHDSDEPRYLLEGGWLGGPAFGNIPHGFVPTLGPAVPPMDRWGNIASVSELKHPAGPPTEKNPQNW